jgi:hypothetical protein
MSQALMFAQPRGSNLATTMMVCIALFQSSDDKFGVMS